MLVHQSFTIAAHLEYSLVIYYWSLHSGNTFSSHFKIWQCFIIIKGIIKKHQKVQKKDNIIIQPVFL